MDKRIDKWRLWQQRLGPLLLPPAVLYSAAMEIRCAAYHRGWLDSWRPPVPCISVGNICSGGSGKTQVCAWLLQWALQQGLQPGLLSRGYKGRPQELPLQVTLESLPQECGDEPLMLARQFPGAYIIVDPKRKRAGQWLFSQGKAGLCILDDGFQHLPVKRDLDLVLLRPEDLSWDWARVLPRGAWREGPKALNRASAFLLKADSKGFKGLMPQARSRLGPLDKPVFGFMPRMKSLLRLIDGYRLSPGQWQGDYVLLSAVGDPQGVERSLSSNLGLEPLHHFAFQDHAFFSREAWQRILNRAKAWDAQVICTPKDAVKLEAFASSRVWTMELALEFSPELFTGVSFRQWLEQSLASC
ncbi:MAG: tetraacyldisaccharide 4'-kinase [Thermodesulfobacteriota bacterium]